MDGISQQAQKVLTSVMSNTSAEMQQIEGITQQKMLSTVESCYARNSNNPDRFADCILNFQQKMAKLMDPLQYKLLFLTKGVENCLMSKSEEECTEIYTNFGKKIVEGNLNDINRL